MLLRDLKYLLACLGVDIAIFIPKWMWLRSNGGDNLLSRRLLFIGCKCCVEGMIVCVSIELEKLLVGNSEIINSLSAMFS